MKVKRMRRLSFSFALSRFKRWSSKVPEKKTTTPIGLWESMSGMAKGELCGPRGREKRENLKQVLMKS